MNPRILRAYTRAEALRRNRMDEQAWWQGMYHHHAVLAALDKGFNGKKSKVEYPERPYSEQAKASDSGVDNKVKLLFASLEVMQSNYEINNKSDKADSVS